MANKSGNAYALTVLSPIRNGNLGETAYAEIIRHRLNCLAADEASPLARVPNTYLARLFILDDVMFESNTANDAIFNFKDILSFVSDSFRRKALPYKENLQSRYLVFSSNFHGDLDTYLNDLWAKWESVDDGERHGIRYIWEHCVAFDQVTDARSFAAYIKKCQLNASLFFNGSTDDPLQEQLKALYLKQEFTNFAVDHQGESAEKLQKAFKQFIQRVQPENLAGPSWVPGQADLKSSTSAKS